MATMTYKWSDNDRRLGPFIYARDKGNRLAIVLDSGDDDHPGCRIRVSAFGRTFIAALPPVIWPWRIKRTATYWSAEDIARMGRDWYWETHRREYGAYYGEGFLQVFLGRQTDDSSTEQRWSCFLPWTQWRHVRHSLYGEQGEFFATEPMRTSHLGTEDGRNQWDKWRAVTESCASKTFRFADFDGEELTVNTRIEEREWHFGTGWFKWLRFFRKSKISRSLNLQFSGETGRRKGSWKGGTTGHAIEMLPGELHEAAFRRYCAEHEMTFIQ